MKRLAIVLAVLLGFGGMVIAQNQPSGGQALPQTDSYLPRQGDDGLVSVYGATGQADHYAWYVWGLEMRLRPATFLERLLNRAIGFAPDGVIQLVSIENDSEERSTVVAAGQPVVVIGKAERNVDRILLGLDKTWQFDRRWLNASLRIGRDVRLWGEEKANYDTNLSTAVSYGKGAEWSVEAAYSRLMNEEINWERLRGRYRAMTFGAGRGTTDLRFIVQARNVHGDGIPGNVFAGGLGAEVYLPNLGGLRFGAVYNRTDDKQREIELELGLVKRF